MRASARLGPAARKVSRESGPGPSEFALNLIALLSDTVFMPGKKARPAVKKPKTYEALRDKGMSKQRAARLSNAQAKKEKD